MYTYTIQPKNKQIPMRYHEENQVVGTAPTVRHKWNPSPASSISHMATILTTNLPLI